MGLKLHTGRPEVRRKQLQMDPRGVEAQACPSPLSTILCYRWTLVGLKRVANGHVLGAVLELQMDPRGVEAKSQTSITCRQTWLQMDPRGVEARVRVTAEHLDTVLQMDPRGVEAWWRGCYSPSLPRYRWTLVGLKL